MSPSLHLLHHSDNPEHFDCNYNMRYSIFDRFFGTYLDESNLKDLNSFGVKNSQYNKYNPVYASTILPLQKISKRIKNLLPA